MTLQQLQKQNQILKTQVSELTGKLRLYAKRLIRKPVTGVDQKAKDILHETHGMISEKRGKMWEAAIRRGRQQWR